MHIVLENDRSFWEPPQKPHPISEAEPRPCLLLASHSLVRYPQPVGTAEDQSDSKFTSSPKCSLFSRIDRYSVRLTSDMVLLRHAG